MKTKKLFLYLGITMLIASCNNTQDTPEKILDGYSFTEGPAVNKEGILFFSDVPERKIYQYPLTKKEASLFLDNTGGANGLYFDSKGNMIACAGKARMVISISPQGETTFIVDEYQGKKLNSPNDLWIDDEDGIYFTDPRYGNKEGLEQNGMHVYYIFPDRDSINRVIDNLTRPNGIIGSLNGKKLYVVDEGKRKMFEYDIVDNGVLRNKTLFCDEGIDGMSVTDEGNICITTEMAVSIYSPGKELLEKIKFESQTTNVVFHEDKLFVTTQKGEVWQVSF